MEEERIDRVPDRHPLGFELVLGEFLDLLARVVLLEVGSLRLYPEDVWGRLGVFGQWSFMGQLKVVQVVRNLHSSVASLPESLRMILLPPGWEGRNDVT